MSDNRVIVGVDVGGTFTDLFWLDAASGIFRTAKVPSRRGDEAVGFIDGLAALSSSPSPRSGEGRGEGLSEPELNLRAPLTRLEEFTLGLAKGKTRGLAPLSPAGRGEVSIVHGTTVGTNTLLERRGPKIGVITTRGFRDTLEMRRRDRRSTWGLSGDFVPLADRDLRVEVDERTLADGTVRVGLDPAQVRAAAQLLLAQGARAVAVTFINAYANAENEKRALAALRDVWPNDFVTASHEVLCEIREFERSSTAAINAYLQPVVAAYLAKLEAALAQQRFPGQLHIVQSNGGIMSVETARRLPVRTALSGPAAGVVAGAALARAAGCDNLITCDLGGTSFDVSVIAGGRVAVAAQTTVDFGLVIRTPMIEITTIGAGGGSIALVDRGGLLQVGPESAGSVPGPACYGAGNTRPTLTDAQVLLGRINAARPLGGELASLDVAAARAAIDAHVGRPLGLATDDAAAAIVRVAEARMAGAIRLVSIERGHDPARFVAVPFGGGGALHVGALIREIGLKSALVPRFPGITSALGCVLADLRHDSMQTLNVMLDGVDAAALARRMQAAAREAGAVIAAAGIAVARTDTEYELDMHYLGQTHTVAVPLPVEPSRDDLGVSEAMMSAAFEAAYLAAFGRLLPGLAARIVSLRVAAIGRRPPFDFAVFAPIAGATVAAARRTTRPVWFTGGWRDTAIFARLELPAGAQIDGPAILEQPDATVVIEPGMTARVDAFGNLIVAASPA
ncbi:MAG TPA: hydantoinase/oxoprolinase family protein [Xanthobacteraceae bacterium]